MEMNINNLLSSCDVDCGERSFDESEQSWTDDWHFLDFSTYFDVDT